MAAQAQYHDQKTGWTWGGVLKGVATVIGAAVVSCVVWSGLAMAVGAAAGVGAGSTAAWMVGSSAGLENIWQIPGQFAGFISGGLFKAAEVTTNAVSEHVVKPATELGGKAVDVVKGAATTGAEKVQGAATGLYESGQKLAAEYGKPAAAVVGAGAAGYWVGKTKGKSEQKQNFRDMVTKGREQAALDNISRA